MNLQDNEDLVDVVTLLLEAPVGIKESRARWILATVNEYMRYENKEGDHGHINTEDYLSGSC